MRRVTMLAVAVGMLAGCSNAPRPMDERWSFNDLVAHLRHKGIQFKFSYAPDIFGEERVAAFETPDGSARGRVARMPNADEAQKQAAAMPEARFIWKEFIFAGDARFMNEIKRGLDESVTLLPQSQPGGDSATAAAPREQASGGGEEASDRTIPLTQEQVIVREAILRRADDPNAVKFLAWGPNDRQGERIGVRVKFQITPRDGTPRKYEQTYYLEDGQIVGHVDR